LNILGRNYHGYDRAILCLEGFSQINLKGIYDGPELSERSRKGIATFTSNFIPYKGQPYKLTHTDVIILDVKELAELKYGKNILTQALPHYERPDIIYCFDENGKSVTHELLDIFPPRNVHPGIIFSKDRLFSQKPHLMEHYDKYKLVSIIVGGRNFFIKDTKNLTGPFRMKFDQLKMIGYHPILVSWDEWVDKSIFHRENLLERKLNGVLSTKN
jgi:hypothetical protein